MKYSWRPFGSLITAVLMIVTLSAAPAFGGDPLPGGGLFFDDDTSVHQSAIEAIATVGITRGCNPPYQTGFCPDDSVTRGQMAAFMTRALGLSDSGGGNLFIDDNSSIFEADIAKLAASGITKGCNPPANTRFCPDDIVTRGQMAAFLVRAMGYAPNAVDMFDDDNGSVFESNINALGKVGITLGCNPPANTKYCPDQPVTRAQMATFLTRALELPTRAVPPRLATFNGTDLAVFQESKAQECPDANGDICEISVSVAGEFYLDTGWSFDNWSTRTEEDKAEFQSDGQRLEATFDGVPIDLVAWSFEVIDDIAYKYYSFQFPAWLEGSHVLEVKYIDEADNNFVWTIRDIITASGTGYPGGTSVSSVPIVTGVADRRDSSLKTP